MSEAAVPGGIRGRIGAARLLSDDRLAERAIEGDELAFAAIYGRYHQDLYRFCLVVVGSPQDAQDALQNTMVKVLRALPGEQRRIELKPWLYRIAHNESIELLRRRRPTEELDPELLTRGGGLAEEAEMRQRLRRLIADLEQLPERQRGALVMRELAGLDYAEIAAALGTSPAVARQALYEARLSLRQMDAGREMTCATVTRALSDGDGRVTRRRDIRAHLRACPDCRRFRAELEDRRDDLAALSPLPTVAAAGLLQGVLGGAGGSAGAGAGLAGAAGGAAAKSLGTTAAIKSAAAVAVVAAVGVGVADRSGVVDATPWGGSSQQQQTQAERAAGAGTAPSRSEPIGSGAAVSERGAAAVKQAAALGAGARAGNKSGAAAGAAPAAANGEAPAAPAGHSSDGSHPHGRGHEKQHPAAAAKGQQTAAAHKAAGKGAGGAHQGGGSAKSNSSHPAKPPKPPPPSKPSKPSKPSGEGGPKVETSPKSPPDPGAATPPQPSPSAQSSEPRGPQGPPEAGKGNPAE